jgi:RsiW-degrading membrane proteinase PrsW (M82 family)
MGFVEAAAGLLGVFLRGNLLIVLLGLAPGVFWLWWFHRRDLEPEPIKNVVGAFVVGALLTVPALVVQLTAQPLIRLAFPDISHEGMQSAAAWLVAPISEEALKFLATVLIIRRLDEFDEPLDGIIYGVSTALGFAALENAAYLMQAARGGLDPLSHTAVARSVLSVPAHALFACVWGYALGRARFLHCENLLGMHTLSALFVAMCAHSLFNIGCSFRPLFTLVAVGLVIVLWEVTEHRIQTFLVESPHTTQPEYRMKLAALKDRLGLNKTATKWYESRTKVLILLFVIFPPVGLYGLHRTTVIMTHMKWVYFTLWLGLTFVATRVG